jgi:hypothetical protein
MVVKEAQEKERAKPKWVRHEEFMFSADEDVKPDRENKQDRAKTAAQVHIVKCVIFAAIFAMAGYLFVLLLSLYF